MTDGDVGAMELDNICIDVTTAADTERCPSIHIPAVMHPFRISNVSILGIKQRGMF